AAVPSRHRRPPGRSAPLAVGPIPRPPARRRALPPEEARNMLAFAHIPEFWLGGALGLIAGMLVTAALSFIMESAESERLERRQLPPTSGTARTWPEAHAPRTSANHRP